MLYGLQTVLHICGWMDRLNQKNGLTLLNLSIQTLLSMFCFLQHMVNQLIFHFPKYICFFYMFVFYQLLFVVGSWWPWFEFNLS